MSATREHEKGDSASILERIPIELWNRILNEQQGFTTQDFKTLCFVAPLFKIICQPAAYRSLIATRFELSHGYCFEDRRKRGANNCQMDQWRLDMASLIRAERRLSLVGGDPALSTFPQTISIGAGVTSRASTINPPMHQPLTEMVLSWAAYDVFLQLKGTLVRTLPLYTHLRRLEFRLLPIDDGLLRAIASHPVLYELKLEACSFPSPTFPLPRIRLLEYDEISQEQAPAAFRLASSQHLEELQIDNMGTPAVLEGLRARPETESMLKKLRRLKMMPASNKLKLLDMEELLSYVPALHQLDISYRGLVFRKETRPWTCLRYRTCNGLRVLSPSHDTSYPGGLSATSEVGTVNTATAEGITTLHLPLYNVAPIWLLSRFVAETFPRLVDLRLPVGMIQDSVDIGWGTCCFGAPRKLMVAEESFEDGVVEGMVKLIKDKVEYELVTSFDNPSHQAMDLDYQTRRVTSHSPPIPTFVSPPEVDVAVTLAGQSSRFELDSTGHPLNHPKNYEEALIYFSQGWYPIPTSIQTLSLRPGSFPGHKSHQLEPCAQQETCITVVTALGERYPNLAVVTLYDGDVHRCERIRGIGNGTTRWTILAT
ncbi:hypothetical protein EST38_g3760 [Candolleomyces aberdarensis]|uniref:Uncharacterized protein n=1 Tax=Candolleomyces aberdarensis TaxID=2316362 RepID=A0A4Q2DS97_9AGAR|nr:hypothetical protein EST38_g3760 [Candolleomyces aberdarensis]